MDWWFYLVSHGGCPPAREKMTTDATQLANHGSIRGNLQPSDPSIGGKFFRDRPPFPESDRSSWDDI